MDLLNEHLEPDARAFTATGAASGYEEWRWHSDATRGQAIPKHSSDQLLAALYEIDPPRRIDAGIYLNAICKLMQSAAPAYAEIQCVVEDYDTAMLSESICRLLGLVLCELIRAASAATKGSQVQIRVALRRRGAIAFCGMSTHQLAEASFCAKPGLLCIEHMSAGLGNSGLVRVIREQSLIGIMLDTDSAERSIPAAISAYRFARESYRSARAQAAQ